MNVEAVLSHQIEQVAEYAQRDAMLYALGVNVGLDPTNERHLSFLFEEDLKILPGFAMVLAHPGFWLRDPRFEADWMKLLHAEQHLAVLQPLPVSGKVRSITKVIGIRDKGHDRGAILYSRKALFDVETGEKLAEVTLGSFLRGDGGCGDHGDAPAPLESVPERAPDVSESQTIDPRAALIYRLSGDYNPIHASPSIAREAGFDRPILHGLCTMGIAGQILLEEVAGGDPAAFGGYACRFSRPVFPGDRIRIDIWNEENGARFRAVAIDRDEVVLDRGRVWLSA